MQLYSIVRNKRNIISNAITRKQRKDHYYHNMDTRESHDHAKISNPKASKSSKSNQST